MPPKSKPKASDQAALQALKQALKEGRPGPLYVLYGEETYLRDYYLRQLKAQLLPPGLEDFNLHTVQGSDCSVEWIEQLTDSVPVMSERTMVLVTDFDLSALGERPREQLIQLLAQLPDYCCLVFFYDILPYKLDGRSKLAAALKNHGCVVNFQRQKPEDLVPWIVRRFKAEGQAIHPEDARYLLFLCGDLMTNLASEIHKISTSTAAPHITRQHIDAVAIPQVEAIVFQMTDAVARRDFEKAAAVLADLLHNQEEPVRILAAMSRYFLQLYTARLYLDHARSVSQLAQTLGLSHPWQGDKLMDAARRFSLPWCRHALGRCAQTELAIKSSALGGQEALISLLMELSAGRKVISC
ncbi:MAG TPA: DNA polymerase III subunit delta [Clostridiales bacterium]|nr:DNA polymerase III subunit delta [Clostridiales bacterium]